MYLLAPWIALDPPADEREVEADNVSEYGIHAAQVLWKSTSDLGCSLASCSVEATPYTYLVCQYDPP